MSEALRVGVRLPIQEHHPEWADWSDPSIVRAWIHWREKSEAQSRELKRAFLNHVGLPLGAHVLDLASGTGEPALTIAELVGPQGRVVATDIREEFLSVILGQGEARGLANLTVVQADATQIPFPDETFDVATSQMGAMYFDPISKAFAEILRVLKPAGRVALLTWGMPEGGSLFSSGVLPFLQRSNIMPPHPLAPTPLRFSPPGSLAAELAAAGFREASEERLTVELAWPGPPEEAWQHLYETSPSLRHVFDALDSEEFAVAHAEALEAMGRLWDGQATRSTMEIVIGTGYR